MQNLEPNPESNSPVQLRSASYWPSRRAVLALLFGTPMALACRSASRPTEEDEAVVRTFVQVSDWIDSIVGEDAAKPGFAALMRWLEREVPTDITDSEMSLLFAELFLEGRSLARNAADASATRLVPQDSTFQPPLTFQQTANVLEANLDLDTFQPGFVATRLARAKEVTVNDPSRAAVYRRVADLQDHPLFKKKKNGGKCGVWCRVRNTLLIVTAVLALVAICVFVLEGCKEKIVP